MFGAGIDYFTKRWLVIRVKNNKTFYLKSEASASSPIVVWSRKKDNGIKYNDKEAASRVLERVTYKDKRRAIEILVLQG